MEAEALYQLNKVARSLVRTPGRPGDLESVLQHIAETAANAFGPDICVIRAINPITTKFLSSPVAVGDLKIKNEELHEKPRPEGITQLALKDGELFIEDLENEGKRRYHNRFTFEEGIHAVAGLTLSTRHRKRPLGVIYLNFRQPREFSATERESYHLFAVQASFLLQEAWLARNYEEVARIGQEVNQILSTNDDLFKVLQTYVDTVLDESHTLLLAVYQPQTNRLDVHTRKQEQSTNINMPLEGACKYVFETQECLFIEHYSKEAKRLTFHVVNITETEEQQSFIFVPILLRNEFLGVLSIQHPSPKAYGREDLFVLQLLANYIALALHNMRLYNSLNQLNETGQLLTRQLESPQTLQATAEKIREATQADVIVLYPYELALQRFVLPPLIAGEMSSSREQMSTRLSNDLVRQALQHELPIFAKQGITLYTALSDRGRIRRENFQQREQIRSTAMIPLKVGDKKVGVLFVNFRQAQRFDPTQKLFIEGLAHFAAIAIRNAQIMRMLSLRRVRELQILAHINRELNRTLDLESVLNTLLTLANKQIHADAASILLYNPQTEALEPAAAIGQYSEIRQELSTYLRASKGITRWALEQRSPARVGNVHTPEWRDIYIQAAVDTKSELVMPLYDGEEKVGVLNFESKEQNAFHEEDEDFLRTLAGNAVLAIKKAQAYEREKRLAEENQLLAEERQLLNEISKEITSQLDPARVFDLFIEKASEMTHSNLCSLMLYDPDQNNLYMVAERGVAENKKFTRQSLDQGIVGYVATHKQLLNVKDVSQPSWNEIYLEFIPGTRSELAVPMIAGNELRGVLNIESFMPNHFSASDERLLQGLADLAVVALQNAQAYEREKRLAEERQLLNEISKEITSQFDHMRVFALILEKTLELTRSTLGALLLYAPESNDLWIADQRGLDQNNRNIRIGLDHGIVGYVATHKKPLTIGDVSQPPWNSLYLKLFLRTCSELAVPMLAGDELRGVINVESISPYHFTESDERLLQGLADLAVVALQNAKLYNQAKMEAKRFELLYQVGQDLSKITNVEQLNQAYDIILDSAEKQSDCQVVIRRYDAEAQELELIRASKQLQSNLLERSPLDDGVNGQVAREKHTIVVEDTQHPPAGVITLKLTDPTTRSLVVTPIMLEYHYYGNLGLRHEEVGHFRNADIKFFEGLAQQLASTIYRVEVEQRALAAEEMNLIGEIALGLAHRLVVDLGPYRSYIDDIREELERRKIRKKLVLNNLNNIEAGVRKVLIKREALQDKLKKSREAIEDERVVVAPEELFRDAIQDMDPSLLASVSLKIELEDGVAKVWVYTRLVIEILQDLVINAIHAMGEGGTITLKASNAGRYVAVDVSDTGIGIPQENQAKIFNLFYSTEGGFGFGLWSAHNNAVRNRGNLKILESQLGRGTTFRLNLPKVDVENRIAFRQ